MGIVRVAISAIKKNMKPSSRRKIEIRPPQHSTLLFVQRGQGPLAACALFFSVYTQKQMGHTTTVSVCLLSEAIDVQ